MAETTSRERGRSCVRAARHVGAAVLALALATGLTRPAAARAAPDDEARARREQLAAYKRLEADLIVEPARREWTERAARLREVARATARRARVQHSTGPARPGARSRLLVPSPLRRGEPLGQHPRNPKALAPNIRVNGRNADATQSEVSVAAHGFDLLAAWNDGSPAIGGPTIGYATSTDGGATWSPTRMAPLGARIGAWVSDPVVTVNERTGVFTLVGLAIATGPPTNAVAVVNGTFADSGFVWSVPMTVRAPRDTLPDKPWIVADSLTGNLYLTYTTFYLVGDHFRDHIDFQRSEDGGRTWSAPRRLSRPEEEGLVQGSRPVATTRGGVDVVWATVDTSAAGGGRDALRFAASRDRGADFDPPRDLASVFTNFASGAPGFDRGWGVNFPSVAVDRGRGPHRGRVYVCWTESLNYFDDLVGGGAVLDARSSVTRTLRVGDVVVGTLPDRETEVFELEARQGETAVFRLDSLGRHRVALTLTCAEGGASLAYSDPPHFGRDRLAIATFPWTGRYRVQLANRDPGPTPYRLRTGLARRSGERGRDVRDVFASYSDDGVQWSEPARVSDAPPFYDDWLPEVGVSAGTPYVAWYDWRNSPADRCGASSDVFVARSPDGGDHWQTIGPVTDESSDWSAAVSNLSPNQGDYIAMWADARTVRLAWADARRGDPDAFFAELEPSRLVTSATGTVVAFDRVQPNPARDVTSLAMTVRPGAPARLELWDVAGRLRLRRELAPSATGHITTDLGLDPRLPAGVYLVRVVQAGFSAATRLAIVR